MQLEERLAPDEPSAGPDVTAPNPPSGIRSRGLIDWVGNPLTGAGVAIGQVEHFRPAKPGQDPNAHPDVSPTEVYYRDNPLTTQFECGDHAESVAGVMIANGNQHGGTHKGVAPQASLFASAVIPIGDANANQHQYLISMQHIATRSIQGGGDSVSTINLSIAVPGPALDGQSRLTLGLDWSARQHDVLYVVAAGNTTARVPVDSYNGLTVGFSMQVDGSFRKVDPENASAVDSGNRRLTNLIAPGRNILMPRLNGGPYLNDSGSSFAAPHATATVALLEQYAKSRLVSCPGWAQHATRHEVMKAVLMNSTDKLQDNGDHKLLDMERTVLKKNGEDDWLDSDARDSIDNPVAGRDLPLDLEMGTGHLNARRARHQFLPGEWAPGIVPSIGWDFDDTGGAGTAEEYVFDRPLVGGSYVAITLVWDRLVDNIGGDPGVYEENDTFNARPLVNLDLHLLRKNDTSHLQALWSSWSTSYNVEHIFYQLPAGDAEYKFWVVQTGLGDGQDYAVAWWTYPTIPPQLV